MIESSRVRFTGPLSGHAEGLWRELLSRGYTPLSARNVLRVAAHLSRWLEEHRLSLDDLSAERIDAFFVARRRAGYTGFLTPCALAPVLQYLEQAGVVSLPEPDTAQASPLERLLHLYAQYLLHERAVATSTAHRYGDVARRFLCTRFAPGPIKYGELSAHDVTTFVLNRSRQYSPGTTKYIVTALRSFLRYLYLNGELAVDLTGAVPAVAHWRLAGLPKGLDAPEVRRLLRTCDRRRPEGRKHYALLLLMVRLGLRSCEVAALELDDIDWVQGEMVVRGKGREERLPVPEDIGVALAHYLRSSRPRTRYRHLFLRTRAPHGPLSSGGLKMIVRKHLLQAGVHPPSPHRLRHTAATQMLRNGASLDNIAQVLRHRSHDTTAIYAKVDRRTLRAVALPWPGERS